VKPYAAILLIFVLLAGGFAGWLRHEIVTPYYGASGPETFVDIPHGAGLSAIATKLRAGGILRHELPFVLYVRWFGFTTQLKAGEYLFKLPASPAEIVRRLAKGDVYYRTVTIPEGLTSAEILAVMTKAGLGSPRQLENLLARVDWIADIAPGATALEGYLFPETYRFSRRTTPEQILKAMTVQFRTHMKAALSECPLPAGWTIPQIVTLASLIEKEAKDQDERKLVASVLTNRLRLKMPLACDPTIIYALKTAGTYDGNLRKADLGVDSPYNTYLRAGLPPGPIANPGVASLKAALSPARTNYLYYVSRNDGTHVFSTDLRSHQLAVDRFQKRHPGIR
jgi:UPF0755 protein